MMMCCQIQRLSYSQTLYLHSSISGCHSETRQWLGTAMNKDILTRPGNESRNNSYGTVCLLDQVSCLSKSATKRISFHRVFTTPVQKYAVIAILLKTLRRIVPLL